MKIRVPEDIGKGDLKLIPPGPFKAVVKDVLVKKAKSSGEPIAIIRWLLNSEPENGKADFPTTGETVLDTYSLQSQALWRLNDLHNTLMGKNIPPDDYEPEDFQVYLNENFTGKEATLIITNEPNNQGQDRTKVESVSV